MVTDPGWLVVTRFGYEKVLERCWGIRVGERRSDEPRRRNLRFAPHANLRFSFLDPPPLPHLTFHSAFWWAAVTASWMASVVGGGEGSAPGGGWEEEGASVCSAHAPLLAASLLSRTVG